MTAYTLRTPMAGLWVKVYLRRHQKQMHEIDLFFPWSSTTTSLGHKFDPGVLCGVCEGRRKIKNCTATTEAHGWAPCLRCCLNSVGSLIRSKEVLLLSTN